MKGRGLGGVGDEGAAAARVAQVLISAMRREELIPYFPYLSLPRNKGYVPARTLTLCGWPSPSPPSAGPPPRCHRPLRPRRPPPWRPPRPAATSMPRSPSLLSPFIKVYHKISPSTLANPVLNNYSLILYISFFPETWRGRRRQGGTRIARPAESRWRCRARHSSEGRNNSLGCVNSSIKTQTTLQCYRTMARLHQADNSRNVATRDELLSLTNAPLQVSAPHRV